MEKYYFLKSVHEKGKTRVRAMSNQVIPTGLGSSLGEPVDVTLNVQCDKETRATEPLGTIFWCETMFKSTGFYRVNGGVIHPISELDETSELGMEVLEAYSRITGSPASASEVKEAPTSAPRKNTLLEKLMGSKDLQPPSPIKDGFYVDKDIWYYLLRNLALNKNTMLVGPTGTGKTEVIKMLCEKAEREMRVFDMGAMQDPISGLLGVHRLEKDESIFDRAAFTYAIQEDGIIVFDEISRAPSTANNILFPCLDNRRELPLEIASSKVERAISVSEDCCFFATANLGAEYTGTQSLDRALVDRFNLVELDYMPKDVESKVLMNRIKLDKKDADLVVGIASTIRNMYKKGDLSTGISARHTLEIGSLVRDGFAIDKAYEFVLFPMFEGDRKDGERSTLYSLLTSK